MKLKKRVGCLIALVVLAATSVHADTWFTAEISEALTGWTKTDVAYTFADSKVKLNDLEHELRYTAAEKTLPGDIATIATSIKFTAMDAADFADATVPTDAKGGITIVEDENGASKFYVIVNGAWQAVNDKSTADALDGTVPVTVTLSKNKTVTTITYTVNEVEIYSGATIIADNTISEVSYKGVCEIASLTGVASKSVFDLTVPAVDHAVATVTVNGEKQDPKTEGGNVYAIKSGHAGDIVITYAPALGYMTKGETTVTIKGDLDGTTTATVPGDLSSVLVVAKRGASEYESLAYAIAATSDDDIKLMVNRAENVTIGKKVTFDFAGKTYSGVITINEGGELVLKGGNFANIAKADAQELCAEGYFAEVYNTTGSTIVKGTEAEASGDHPAIKVDPTVLPVANLDDDAANGLKKWQNYALGLEPDSAVKPAITMDNDKDTTQINLAANFSSLPQTGLAVVTKVDGVEADSIALPDSDVVTKTVTVTVGGVEVLSTTIGANMVTAKSGRQIVTVPWAANNDGAAVKVADLFKTANLAKDDKVEIYDSDEDMYFTWTWNGSAWAAVAPVKVLGKSAVETPAADAYSVARGQAVYFTGKGAAYQVGTAATTAATTTIAGVWGQVANPITGSEKTLSAIAGTPNGATVQYIDDKGKTVLYSCDGEKWTYDNYVETTKVVRGKATTIGKFEKTVGQPTIAPGKDFWFMNEGSSAATLNW